MKLSYALVVVSLFVGCGNDPAPAPQPESTERVVQPEKPEPLPETGCLEAVD